MAERIRGTEHDDKRGGYSGSKPGASMAPPAKLPSAAGNGSKEEKK